MEQRSQKAKGHESSKSGGIEVIKPTMPKGGGAIQGMGETFQADEFTGTASLSIPFATTACRGAEPHLGLNYSSGSGNGLFGMGVSMGLPSVSRQTSKRIPTYDDSDTFLFSGVDYLVPDAQQPVRSESLHDMTYSVKRYRPRVEGGFARIEHWVQSTGDSFWKVHTSDNSVNIFGKTAQARISDPEDPQRIFEWLLEETVDAHGNATAYFYKAENADNVARNPSEMNRQVAANRYPQRICYGNAEPLAKPTLLQEVANEVLWHFEVVFDYGEYRINETHATPYTPVGKWAARPDPFSTYSAGFELRTHRLCRHVLMFHRFPEELGDDPVLVHALKLTYDTSPVLCQLREAQHIGFKKNKTAAGYTSKSLPALKLSFTGFDPLGHDFETFKADDVPQLPGVEGNGPFSLTDLKGEGIPGILYADGQSMYYRAAEGKDSEGAARFSEWNEVAAFPIDRQVDSASHSLVDFTGTGRLDLLVSTPVYSGYYSSDSQGQWTDFVPLESMPATYRDPYNRHSDLTGDGLSDLVRIEEDQVVVYPAKRRKGFGNALLTPKIESLPTTKPGASEEFLGFADLLGAGKPQLVRIKNRVVECWPSLGYGRFGKKITLENPPQFAEVFDASRLRLVDVDGTGATDLLYIHSDHVQLYFNQSGNGFTKAHCIHLPTAWDNLSQVQLADVRGNGTHCLVFTKAHPEPQHWFYDFCQGIKPYLLCETDNQMGAVHTVHYAPSTDYYLRDKREGKPWVTRLPFPVQVVAATRSIDRISGTELSSEYHYHHGFYDEEEREFRGFGRVDRLDTETVKAGQDKASKNYVAPALNKTWYHTGAWIDGRDLREHYAPEFFSGDVAAKSFPFDAIDLGEEPCDEATVREAYRALKGHELRSELYGLDGTEWEQNPYTVHESQQHVRLLQARESRAYAVFLLHQRESIDYHYERNPADPMVSQDFALELDKYGHVVRSCHVAYPRRGEGLPEQKLLRAIGSDTKLLHLDGEADAFLLGIPTENASRELTGLTPGSDGYFDFASLRQQVEEQLSTALILGWERHYYFDPEAGALLPLGEVTPQALPGRTESAAMEVAATQQAMKDFFTPEALGEMLVGNATEQGGYITYPNEPESRFYWNPGPQQHYAGPALFYQPSHFVDPFGHKTHYRYDDHRLVVTTVIDPLGNTSAMSEIDYAAMTAQRMTDANGNASEVRFDALGMVTVTAHHGTDGGKRKGFPELADYNAPPEPASTEKVLAEPEKYLQGAASFFYYDAWSWANREEPLHALSLAAEKYPDEAAATENITISVAYHDGFGRDLQHKLRVREAGEARVLNEEGLIETVETETRWLTSGAVRYNNKGSAIQQFEPFYAATHRYIDHREYNEVGVSATLYYDPLERVVRTELPKARDGEGKLMTIFTKVEWGAGSPSAWEEHHFDANDTIKDSDYYQRIFDEDGKVRPDSPIDDKHEIRSLLKAAVFYQTPDVHVVDNLGHTIETRQWLKDEKSDGVQVLSTKNAVDIQGQVIRSTDPRLGETGKHNLVMDYTLFGSVIRTVSVDAGTHYALANAVGNPLFTADARGTILRGRFDELHRPIQLSVKNAELGLDQCVQAVLYGDSRYTDPETNESKPYFQTPEKWNSRGMPVVSLGESGLDVSAHYHFAGQPLASGKRITKSYKEEVNWNALDTATWRALATSIALLSGPDELPELALPEPLTHLLQTDWFTTFSSYDALGRAMESKDPDGNISRPKFYSTGLLKSVSLEGQRYDDAPSLERITYDAKGQRLGIRYGNGVQSRYSYDACTYELKQLRTTRNNGEVLQDIRYWYDLDANVSHITDASCPTVFCNGQQVDPDADYTYDSLYRLICATGREHAGLWKKHQTNATSLAQSVNDANKLQNYEQFFHYDAGGNLLEEKHIAADSNACHTRRMTADTGSNRVLSSTFGSCDGVADTEERYTFDANGNQRNLGQLTALNWNYRNNIRNVVLIDRGEKPSDAEYYMYDSSGHRVRKVTERWANDNTVLNVEETIYLGGFEVHLKKQQAKGQEAAVNSEWHTVRFDPAAAEWRYNIKGDLSQNTAKSQVRYQLENHLNSSVMELDGDAQVITWEEYYPYGGTAVQAGRSQTEIKAKRYRYSGKEKDANTGLYYYGMRYYCSWLGRWLSADPAGTIDGLNLYAFVGGNPIKHVDVGGMVKKENKQKEEKSRFIKDVEKIGKTRNRKKVKNEYYQDSSVLSQKFLDKIEAQSSNTSNKTILSGAQLSTDIDNEIKSLTNVMDSMLKTHKNRADIKTIESHFDNLKIALNKYTSISGSGNVVSHPRKQDMTEVRGEVYTTQYMLSKNNSFKYKMVLGFEKGVGIDQLWEKNGKKLYVVEAKGSPNAKTTDTGGRGFQMSDYWIGSHFRTKYWSTSNTTLQQNLAKYIPRLEQDKKTSKSSFDSKNLKLDSGHQLRGLIIGVAGDKTTPIQRSKWQVKEFKDKY